MSRPNQQDTGHKPAKKSIDLAHLYKNQKKYEKNIQIVSEFMKQNIQNSVTALTGPTLLLLHELLAPQAPIGH